MMIFSGFHLLLTLFSITIINVDSIIFYQGHTTACDQCDRISTNSVRNILCCMKFSKCCLPNSLDEYNAQVEAEDDIYYGRVKPNINSNRNNGNGSPSSALLNNGMNRKQMMKKKKKQSSKQKKRKQTSNKVNKRKRPSTVIGIV
ncbi:hypothetical protein DERF_006783 [Dermatophagoides farinae]|uniref:Uncharacterized protein n=1 Tax=Dermatophagoides farinae TaxID=6954 RepID=A0A922HXT8_DERFA|nr:hypothetical protein DERF_006783 [Dermatophagoides farinae]